MYIVGVLHGLFTFNVQANGTINTYFTIAGYDSTSGIVKGYEYPYKAWTGPDIYGTYRISYNNVCHGLYEWITAFGPLNYKKLNDAGKVPDRTWVEGSYYYDKMNKILYWKPYGGTITNKTATVYHSSAVYLDGRSWVKVTNLKTVGTEWCIGSTAPSNHIWLDHLTIENTMKRCSYNAAIQVGLAKTLPGTDNVRISYCTISDGDNGIYTFSQSTSTNNDNIKIDHNTITNMYGNADAHCIGFQGGSNNIIEYNDLSYCNTGITMFSFARQQANKNIIRYNHVYKMEGNRAPDPGNKGWNRGYGIGWEGNVTDPSLRTENWVYYNIVHDCSGNIPFGINSKAVKGSLNYTLNNVVRNCNPSYRISGNGSGIGVGGVYQNNISLEPGGAYSWHWQDGAFHNGDYSGITVNHNLYYPDGNRFRLGNRDYNFAGWKNQLRAKNVRGADLKSNLSDPLFINSSGSYFKATDFQIKSASPTIDNGDNSAWSGKPGIFDFTGSTGITDSSGTIIAPGGVVDIGAYEGAIPESKLPRPPINLKVINE
ncbi:hypothetical protein [Syntrophus aciditrophicus]|uniref:hypothetical protein n=1 Tax=Syntrophus aciditrophicus TaxID=316277 RepID=UPI0011D102B1|nr:hypothetical protein [Syntrophus aciditrophicus]